MLIRHIRQAIQEARRRWGARAFCYRNPGYPRERRFEIGFCDGYRDICLGRGASWQEAFAQAPSDTPTNDQMIALPDGTRSEFARRHDIGD